MIISFLSNVILARLLTPDDFGIIGMLFFFISIANTFIDSGLGSALIQKKNPTVVDYSTVFHSNFILSLFFYFLLFFTAPLIADYYKVEILTAVLRVEGLVLILNSFCLVQNVVLRKNLDLKKLSIVNIVGNIAGLIVGVTLAYMGYGVWSLVVRMIVVSFVVAVLLWKVSPFKPLFRINKSSFTGLFSFGGFMLLSSVVTSVSNNLQTVIIGKLFSTNQLGYFTQAKQLRDVPSTTVSSVLGQVIYPVFANIKENKAEVRNRLETSVSLMSYLITAIMGLLIFLAKPLILLLYSDVWIQSVGYFQILCVGGVFLALQDINYYVIAAYGKSKILFLCNLCQVIIGVVLMIVGSLWFGMDGLLVAMVITSFVFYVGFAIVASRCCESSVLYQLKSIAFSAILTLVSIGTLVATNNWLPIDSNIISITFNFLLFSIIYIGLFYLLCKKQFYYIVSFFIKKAER